MRLKNIIIFKSLLIVFSSFCAEIKAQSSEDSLFYSDNHENDPEELSYCMQSRTTSDENCKDITDNFCSKIQCEPVLDCDTSDHNKQIVNNITGRGCCPACVQFSDEDENCEVGSKVKRCRNGLFCDPSTKQCNLPDAKNKCLIDFHNRRLVRENRMKFYVEAAPESPKPSYFEMKYASDIEYPTCDQKTGKYTLKQCRKSKCFCVNPEDGKSTFGVIEDYKAENVTCECANFFNQKLVVGKTDKSNVDIDNMEHYAQIHSKCQPSGNFEPLQCINSTCFCVDEKTGKPTPERAAIYGALSTLSCFDDEKSKKLKSKEADPNYMANCEKQQLRTQSISLHFLKKGAKIRGLDSVACQFDGQFAPIQCLPGICNCVDLKGTILGSYGADRGKIAFLDCKCAREEYFAATQKLAFNHLQCDSFGNFNAFQCFEDGRECYCVDEDGSRISESEPSYCLDKFIKEKDQGLSKNDICMAMRRSLTDNPLSVEKFYQYDKKSNQYQEIDNKPANFYCNAINSQCKCANS